MSATDAKAKQELKVKGRREVAIALIRLRLHSLIIHNMIQRDWYKALPSTPITYLDKAGWALFISAPVLNTLS